MARTRFVPFLPALVLLALGLSACGGQGTSTGPLPEDRFTYAISHFVIPRDPQDPLGTMRKVVQAAKDLEAGTPFEEVARSRRPREGDEPTGGWLGFMRPQDPEPMTGAFQAILPGHYSGPFEQNEATHFIYRHTFEEGRAIEAREVIPAYGFILANDPEQLDANTKDIDKRAEEAWARVRRGELTLGEAATQLGATVQRSDAFFRNVRNLGQDKELYGTLAKVEPGELAPLTKLSGALLFMRRGVYFRSQVRHILIQHIESRNRPLSVSRSKAEAKALAEKLLGEIRDGALSWEEAVRRHTDEVATLPLHGWVGAITNGELIPEFETAILATTPGHLADEILESGDGFHVIYRVK